MVGLVPLPLDYFLFLVAVVITYLALVEVVKQRLMNRLHGAVAIEPGMPPAQERA